MNLQEIEQNVAALDPSEGFEFIFELLRAYEVPKATISRLKSGSRNRSKSDNEVLWKGRLYYRYLAGGEDPYVVIDDAGKDPAITKERPRFLIVHNEARLLAVDSRMETTLDIAPHELSANAAFFLPWAGIEKTQLEMTSYADIRAAEKMARLYDEIVKHNELSTPEQVHDLNVFFSRLLFCFFAEDTGVFEKGSFTNALASLTATSGEDTAGFLDSLFKVLDLPDNKRKRVPAHFRGFGYVNGKLFARQAAAPKFSAKARKVILECGTLNWSEINPDIFGSMIQAVVHHSERESLGIHYTSVENIMKVIRPLLLDDLHDAFEAAQDDPRKLERLLDRMSRIRLFDPACGSGNFLVIAYKELRRLEHRILQRLGELDNKKTRMFSLSSIKLENFFGIEIDDFAHEIAILSLWLAKHQMNVEFRELFGVEIALIPLKDTGNIICGNAARLDWHEVCPPSPGEELYLASNPPYQGGTLQGPRQKEDLTIAFDDPTINKYLDYVSLWLFKGAKFVETRGAELGFVATNSVCQGNHVGLLWSRLRQTETAISFAHSPFRWTNSAKGKAGVICVIIGLSPKGKHSRAAFYTDGMRLSARQINYYLVPDGPDVIVEANESNLSGLPPMVFGSMPRDGGNLSLTQVERDELLAAYPAAAKFLRKYVGAAEFIRGIPRYCLWIPDDAVDEAANIPPIAARLGKVRAFRKSSVASSTQRHAVTPHRFVQCAHRETPSIIVPSVSSERREYLPMGFLDGGTVISNLANAIYDAEPWIFGLIQSRMHMTWMRAVAGRLKSDIRYSSELCYNTFPVQALGSEEKKELAELARGILEAREWFPELSLGELYDPDKMPLPLRAAHTKLDTAVDRLYSATLFQSDEERLQLLFELYRRLIAGESLVNADA